MTVVSRSGIPGGSWLFKTDITDALKFIPVHPSLWHLYGFKWNKEHNFYTIIIWVKVKLKNL